MEDKCCCRLRDGDYLVRLLTYRTVPPSSSFASLEVSIDAFSVILSAAPAIRTPDSALPLRVVAAPVHSLRANASCDLRHC